jgi:hypothetical protein
MNTLSTTPETPDELDRAFSEFFKAQLKQPWPKAPLPPGATAKAEPSELAATRAAEAPRNQPSPASRDNTARARFTLAASVALMLGTCWYLSNGFEPGARPGQVPVTPGPSLLQNGGADGNKFAPLQKIGEDKAKETPVGPPKIDMGKLE